MKASAPDPPKPSGPLGDTWLDPPASEIEELLGPVAAPPRTLEREPPLGLLLAPPVKEAPARPKTRPHHAGDARRQRGGRHLAAHRRHRSAWTLAPAWLALIALGLFVISLMGAFTSGQPPVTDEPEPGTPDTRAAQAAPPAQAQPGQAQGQEGPAPAAPDQKKMKPMQLAALERVEGERLGDMATYTDGVMAGVLATGHDDAGGGLAQVSVQVKLANTGVRPLDATGARVELSFAGQSSLATVVEEARLGTIQPLAEAVGTWVFRMPTDQLGDVSVTLAPTAHHQPVTFHGSSS